MTRHPTVPSAPARSPRRAGLRGLRRHPGRLLVAAGALALLACDSLFLSGYRDVRIVGHIDFSDIAGFEPRIPETATAGVPVEIVFWTIGGGCVQRIDGTEVVRGRESAVVTPYDIFAEARSGDFGCTDDLRYLEHRTTVVFEDPGTARIVLRYSATSDPWDDRIADEQVDYVVEVSPAG